MSSLRFGLDWLIQDVRYAIRGILKNPGFVVTVILTIGIAVGVNTAIFTIFHGYALRPISVKNPDDLYEFRRSGGDFSWQEFVDLQASGMAFSEVLAVERTLPTVQGSMMRADLVSANYFRMLGVRPAIGRTLLPEDVEQPGGAPVMVLSYSTWENQFRRDRQIAGRKIVVAGFPVEIVGVAEKEFPGVAGGSINLWLPITLEPILRKGPSVFGDEHPERLRLVGRLQPGLAVGQARRALIGWMERRDSAAGIRGRRNAELVPQGTTVPLTPDLLAGVMPIFLAFGLLLVVASCNVASMMLAKAISRQREIGTRLALGAPPGRITRQLLTESIVLMVPAALMAFLISQLTIPGVQEMLLATAPADIVAVLVLKPMPPDVRPFAFNCLVVLLSGLFAGLAPRGLLARVTLVQAARGQLSPDCARPNRYTTRLLMGQVAVSVMLLVCSGILVRNTQRSATRSLGFSTEGVIGVQIREKSRDLAIAELTSDQAVLGIGAASKVPFEGGIPVVSVQPVGTQRHAFIFYRFASPEYFEILKIPLLAGRNFTVQEAQSRSPVGIISEATAKRLWHGQNPVGQFLRFDWSTGIVTNSSGKAPLAERQPEVQIIGIAADIVLGAQSNRKLNCLYLPTSLSASNTTLIVRTAGPVEVTRERLQTLLDARFPDSATRVFSIDHLVETEMYPFQFISWMASALGVVALILTLGGVYAILSHVVNQRRNEVSIRLALGAAPGRLAADVIWQTLRPSALAGAAGVVLALALAKSLTSFLVDVSVFDPLAIGIGCGSVVLTCAVAAYIPARRTIKTSPSLVLRHE